jgi:hypothetical protein
MERLAVAKTLRELLACGREQRRLAPVANAFPNVIAAAYGDVLTSYCRTE